MNVATPADINIMYKEAENKLNTEKFMYGDTMNVEHELCDCTDNNWSHRNRNERSKGKFVSHTRKTFNRFTTKNSCTWNITRNTESDSV